MKNLHLVFTLCILSSFALNAQDQKWFKGNTHMHTTFSDGDTPIGEVVDWYHAHGYNFISITDHNKTTIPLDHISREGLRDDFIMIIGNEITSSVHFTAIGVEKNFDVKSIIGDYESGNLKGYDLPEPDTTKVGHSQILINGMLAEGALVFINHPNFSTGISAGEMLKLKGATAIELANAHPSVNNYGNELHIPVEEKWDYLLSNGMQIYGVGSDDEHHLQKWGPGAANPGRSWIMVEAEELTPESILEAISKGRFYASTGVELSSYKHEDREFNIKIDRKKTLKNLRGKMGNPVISNEGNKGFRIDIISKGGLVIYSVDDEKLLYNYTNIDKYIRIRASFTRKKGDKYYTYHAWAQPVFPD